MPGCTSRPVWCEFSEWGPTVDGAYRVLSPIRIQSNDTRVSHTALTGGSSEQVGGPVWGGDVGLCYTGRYDEVERNGWTATCERYFEKRDWVSREREAIKLAKGKVLDVGCSVGRHALYLQQRGFDVMGIDTSLLSVKIARERGLRKARVLSIARIWRRLGVFDTVILFGANWGLLSSRSRARRILRRIHEATTPKGLILASYPGDPEIRPESCAIPEIRQQYEDNARRGRMIGETTRVVRYGRHCVRIPWLDCSTADIDKILSGTGWTRESTVYDADAGVAVIRKRPAGTDRG
jgi:SAM-dependent methyltransferase